MSADIDISEYKTPDQDSINAFRQKSREMRDAFIASAFNADQLDNINDQILGLEELDIEDQQEEIFETTMMLRKIHEEFITGHEYALADIDWDEESVCSREEAIDEEDGLLTEYLQTLLLQQDKNVSSKQESQEKLDELINVCEKAINDVTDDIEAISDHKQSFIQKFIEISNRLKQSKPLKSLQIKALSEINKKFSQINLHFESAKTPESIRFYNFDANIFATISNIWSEANSLFESLPKTPVTEKFRSDLEDIDTLVEQAEDSIAILGHNYYEDLNILSDATQKKIRTSYRKLALIHHPDKSKNTDNDSDDQIKKINAAYEVLGNAEKRRKYDELPETLKNISKQLAVINTKVRIEKIRLEVDSIQNLFEIDHNIIDNSSITDTLADLEKSLTFPEIDLIEISENASDLENLLHLFSIRSDLDYCINILERLDAYREESYADAEALKSWFRDSDADFLTLRAILKEDINNFSSEQFNINGETTNREALLAAWDEVIRQVNDSKEKILDKLQIYQSEREQKSGNNKVESNEDLIDQIHNNLEKLQKLLANENECKKSIRADHDELKSMLGTEKSIKSIPKVFETHKVSIDYLTKFINHEKHAKHAKKINKIKENKQGDIKKYEAYVQASARRLKQFDQGKQDNIRALKRFVITITKQNFEDDLEKWLEGRLAKNELNFSIPTDETSRKRTTTLKFIDNEIYIHSEIDSDVSRNLIKSYEQLKILLESHNSQLRVLSKNNYDIEDKITEKVKDKVELFKKRASEIQRYQTSDAGKAETLDVVKKWEKLNKELQEFITKAQTIQCLVFKTKKEANALKKLVKNQIALWESKLYDSVSLSESNNEQIDISVLSHLLAKTFKAEIKQSAYSQLAEDKKIHDLEQYVQKSEEDFQKFTNELDDRTQKLRNFLHEIDQEEKLTDQWLKARVSEQTLNEKLNAGITTINRRVFHKRLSQYIKNLTQIISQETDSKTEIANHAISIRQQSIKLLDNVERHIDILAEYSDIEVSQDTEAVEKRLQQKISTKLEQINSHKTKLLSYADHIKLLHNEFHDKQQKIISEKTGSDKKRSIKALYQYLKSKDAELRSTIWGHINNVNNNPMDFWTDHVNAISQEFSEVLSNVDGTNLLSSDASKHIHKLNRFILTETVELQEALRDFSDLWRADSKSSLLSSAKLRNLFANKKKENVAGKANSYSRNVQEARIKNIAAYVTESSKQIEKIDNKLTVFKNSIDDFDKNAIESYMQLVELAGQELGSEVNVTKIHAKRKIFIKQIETNIADLTEIMDQFNDSQRDERKHAESIIQQCKEFNVTLNQQIKQLEDLSTAQLDKDLQQALEHYIKGEIEQIRKDVLKFKKISIDIANEAQLIKEEFSREKNKINLADNEQEKKLKQLEDDFDGKVMQFIQRYGDQSPALKKWDNDVVDIKNEFSHLIKSLSKIPSLKDTIAPEMNSLKLMLNDDIDKWKQEFLATTKNLLSLASIQPKLLIVTKEKLKRIHDKNDEAKDEAHEYKTIADLSGYQVENGQRQINLLPPLGKGAVLMRNTATNRGYNLFLISAESLDENDIVKHIQQGKIILAKNTDADDVYTIHFNKQYGGGIGSAEITRKNSRKLIDRLKQYRDDFGADGTTIKLQIDHDVQDNLVKLVYEKVTFNKGLINYDETVTSAEPILPNTLVARKYSYLIDDEKIVADYKSLVKDSADRFSIFEQDYKQAFIRILQLNKFEFNDEKDAIKKILKRRVIERELEGEEKSNKDISNKYWDGRIGKGAIKSKRGDLRDRFKNRIMYLEKVLEHLDTDHEIKAENGVDRFRNKLKSQIKDYQSLLSAINNDIDKVNNYDPDLESFYLELHKFLDDDVDLEKVLSIENINLNKFTNASRQQIDDLRQKCQHEFNNNYQLISQVTIASSDNEIAACNKELSKFEQWLHKIKQSEESATVSELPYTRDEMLSLLDIRLSALESIEGNIKAQIHKENSDTKEQLKQRINIIRQHKEQIEEYKLKIRSDIKSIDSVFSDYRDDFDKVIEKISKIKELQDNLWAIGEYARTATEYANNYIKSYNNIEKMISLGSVKSEKQLKELWQGYQGGEFRRTYVSNGAKFQTHYANKSGVFEGDLETIIAEDIHQHLSDVYEQLDVIRSNAKSSGMTDAQIIELFDPHDKYIKEYNEKHRDTITQASNKVHALSRTHSYERLLVQLKQQLLVKQKTRMQASLVNVSLPESIDDWISQSSSESRVYIIDTLFQFLQKLEVSVRKIEKIRGRSRAAYQEFDPHSDRQKIAKFKKDLNAIEGELNISSKVDLINDLESKFYALKSDINSEHENFKNNFGFSPLGAVEQIRYSQSQLLSLIEDIDPDDSELKDYAFDVLKDFDNCLDVGEKRLKDYVYMFNNTKRSRVASIERLRELQNSLKKEKSNIQDQVRSIIKRELDEQPKWRQNIVRQLHHLEEKARLIHKRVIDFYRENSELLEKINTDIEKARVDGDSVSLDRLFNTLEDLTTIVQQEQIKLLVSLNQIKVNEIPAHRNAIIERIELLEVLCKHAKSCDLKEEAETLTSKIEALELEQIRITTMQIDIYKKLVADQQYLRNNYVDLYNQLYKNISLLKPETQANRLLMQLDFWTAYVTTSRNDYTDFIKQLDDKRESIEKSKLSDEQFSDELIQLDHFTEKHLNQKLANGNGDEFKREDAIQQLHQLQIQLNEIDNQDLAEDVSTKINQARRSVLLQINNINNHIKWIKDHAHKAKSELKSVKATDKRKHNEAAELAQSKHDAAAMADKMRSTFFKRYNRFTSVANAHNYPFTSEQIFKHGDKIAARHDKAFRLSQKGSQFKAVVDENNVNIHMLIDMIDEIVKRSVSKILYLDTIKDVDVLIQGISYINCLLSAIYAKDQWVNLQQSIKTINGENKLELKFSHEKLGVFKIYLNASLQELLSGQKFQQLDSVTIDRVVEKLENKFFEDWLRDRFEQSPASLLFKSGVSKIQDDYKDFVHKEIPQVVPVPVP